ncbi:hypothetical protein ABW20_dc0109752 [Dactylellina cionopaga]|nr:hypothetical protein ABW20_dc0109752 [Dactylellina cionopaga]
MSSPRSRSSLQSLVAQALGVSNISANSSISDKTAKSKSIADLHVAASPNETQPGSIRNPQDPVGTIAGTALPETSGAPAPPYLQFNTSVCQTYNQTSLNHVHNEDIIDSILPSTHSVFSAADVPVPGGYGPVVSIPIALSIPPRHIPVLWVFPAPQPSDPDLNMQEADPEDEGRYQYTLRRYLTESDAEDSYPFMCRLHLSTSPRAHFFHDYA